MIAISDNTYFKIGLCELINELNLCAEDICFIDLGTGAYIMNKKVFLNRIDNIALNAVISSREFFYDRKVIIQTMKDFSKRKNEILPPKLFENKILSEDSILTNNEYSIISFCIDGMSTHEISKALSMSLKSVSTTKRRALAKLKYSNINPLISEVVMWENKVRKLHLYRNSTECDFLLGFTY